MKSSFSCGNLSGLAGAVVAGWIASAWPQPAAAAVLPAVSSLGSMNQQFSSPSRVATDALGNVYVADTQAGQVVVVDAFGRLVRRYEGLAQPLGLAVDGTGNLYVAETGAGRVRIFDASGNPLGALGSGDGEFSLPNYVALGSGGAVYVSDSQANQVKVYENGVRTRTIGGPGLANGKFSFPAGLYLSGGGELFVVDQGNDRIEVFTAASGAFVRAFSLNPAGGTSLSGRAQGVVGDPSGRIYVADAYQGYVKVLSEAGTFLGTVGWYGTGDGELLVPGGVALDGQGRLFVASVNQQRVQVFGLDCFAQLSAAPAQQVAAVGATVSFRVSPACAGPWTYQWRKDGFDLVEGRISGATNAVLTVAGLIPADAGTYTVAVVGPSGAQVSPPAQLLVVTAPAIKGQPTNQTVVLGAVANFSVVAEGGALAYQWLYSGGVIDGATGSALSIPAVQATDAGAYSVRVSNVAGTQTSASATLAVVEAPVFGVSPASQSVFEGGSVTFSAVASGGLPTYQWYRNNTAVPAATTQVLALTNLTPAYNAGYYLVAANAAGAATSAVATLTVIPDTVAPVVLSADSGRATNTIVTVLFSKKVATAAAQALSNYQLVGPGSLSIRSATLANGTNLTLALSGPRVPRSNYRLVVSGVYDTAYTPNFLNPNPTSIPIAGTIELIGINNTSWKYLAPTNNTMDGQPWKQRSFNDAGWTNGLGIFYGNRTNSANQPNPNPGVTLPFSLSTSDPANTKVYTILNVFTNSGNVVRTITYYFRTGFEFPARTNGASLLLRSIIDDGAVFYLNGQEVRRDRMSTGTPIFSTLASSSGSQSWSPALTSAARVLPITNLFTGANTLAVEVHQNSTTSDDVTLGVLLEASVVDFGSPAPTLSITPIRPTPPSSEDTGLLSLSWQATGYVLESAANLGGAWVQIGTASPVVVTTTNASSPQTFYRLRQYP